MSSFSLAIKLLILIGNRSCEEPGQQLRGFPLRASNSKLKQVTAMIYRIAGAGVVFWLALRMLLKKRLER